MDILINGLAAGGRLCCGAQVPALPRLCVSSLWRGSAHLEGQEGLQSAIHRPPNLGGVPSLDAAPLALLLAIHCSCGFFLSCLTPISLLPTFVGAWCALWLRGEGFNLSFRFLEKLFQTRALCPRPGQAAGSGRDL